MHTDSPAHQLAVPRLCSVLRVCTLVLFSFEVTSLFIFHSYGRTYRAVMGSGVSARSQSSRKQCFPYPILILSPFPGKIYV